MPKLRLFYGTDPLESDTIPFPRARDHRFELRLTPDHVSDAIEHAERALDATQARLDDARALLDSGWWSPDDPPRAA